MGVPVWPGRPFYFWRDILDESDHCWDADGEEVQRSWWCAALHGPNRSAIVPRSLHCVPQTARHCARDDDKSARLRRRPLRGQEEIQLFRVVIAADLVADASDGADEGTVGAGIHLFAQVIDVNIHDIGDGNRR